MRRKHLLRFKSIRSRGVSAHRPSHLARPIVRPLGLCVVALLGVWLAAVGSAGPAAMPAQVHGFGGRTLAEWQNLWTSFFLGSDDIAPDKNGNAAIGNVVLLALPNAPGDGTPASLDVTLQSGQAFVLPFQEWIGNLYMDGSVDPFADVDDFRNMDITLKIDGVPVVTQKNVMDFYTESEFDPPLTTDLPPGALAWVFVQSVGMVHPPLSVGKHTITLDESISFSDLGFTEPIEFHNTWNITVKPGR